MELTRVRTAADVAAVTDLVWEFFAYLKAAFPAQRGEIDRYLATYDVAGELADLTTHFAPPSGECLLARIGGAPAGVVMMRRISDRLCELNRMWVRDTARGRGVGRALCERLMDLARDMGFSEMRLETLNRDIPAIPLYEKLGFGPDPEPTVYARANPQIVSMRRVL
ncbi:MAG: GNAT family N-acetyltransferase [Pseudomonadota bacterium]